MPIRSHLEQAFGRQDVTTPKMQAAIREWFDLYYAAPRPGESAAPRLPVLIVNKLCRAAFAEYEARILPPAHGPAADGGKPAWMRRNLKALDAVRTQAVQAALIGGECLLKPVLRGEALDFLPIRRDCYAPLARDAHGELQAVGTMELLHHAGAAYALVERRTATPEGLRIDTRLYALAGGVLGRRLPLNTLPQTAALVPELLLPGVPGVGLATLRTPLFNCVDGSADAVAVYAPAVGLIRAVNRTEQQMEAEFQNGASRVFASEDLLRTGPDGRRTLADDLFVGLADDPANLDLTVYSPTLREQSYLARKQDLLRSCESLIGLKRGLLSEVEATDRTATEITSSAGEYSLTLQDVQNAWADAARQAMTLCDALGRLYGLCGAEDFDAAAQLSIDWGDGVLYDRARVWAEQQQMVADGLLRPELALAWYFDLPHRTEADLAAIRDKYMP